MALNPASAASEIWTAYKAAAAIDDDGNPLETAPTGDFPADWATAYDNYAKQGVVLGATNTGGNKSILESFLRTVTSGNNTTAFSTALANYWATVSVAPGTPSHGGTGVVSVVNDATSKVSLFAAAITASITSERKTPYFKHFIENIQTMAVAQIVWTVTEAIPNVGPVPFPENIV